MHESEKWKWSCSVVPDPQQLHGLQPTRLPRPWDSPGKNTEVGCHCLLQCMKVKSESEVAQLSPTLSDPMDCSLPGSSVHGIFQARVLEWVAIAFSSSVTKSCLSLLCLQGLQHARLPCPSLPPRVCSNSRPLSRWCCPTILSSVAPSPPALNLSQHQGLFQWVSPLHPVTKILELHLQGQSFQ